MDPDKEKNSSGHLFKWVPACFISVLWLIEWYNYANYRELVSFGLYPRAATGLDGILFHPLIHGGWQHLVDNSVPLFVLLTALFYFYRPVAFSVIIWSWVMAGTWMWIAARPATHIGASGLVYALAGFIFFSGMIRKYYRLIALSLGVVFLYGSMVWGIFPIQPHISWEGHLFGAIAGSILAFYFRQEGPQRPKYSWELEEEMENDQEEEAPRFVYTIRKANPVDGEQK